MPTIVASPRIAADPLADIATFPLASVRGSSFDPRVAEVSWVAFTATAARTSAINDTFGVGQALRGMSDILERTWDPGRTAALVRIAARRGASGRRVLDLRLAVGILGARGETAVEAGRTPVVVDAVMGRYPSPFTIERCDAAQLFERVPEHVVAIRQRVVDVTDDAETACVPSRFDRQIESWLDVVEILLRIPGDVTVQSVFAASTLSPSELIGLETEGLSAERIRQRALAAGNPVVARRAERIAVTIVDVAESFSGPLWIGEVLVGSDEQLTRSVVRSLAAAITNELDVVHAGQSSPIVAGRGRLTGGFEVDDAPAREGFAVGLPGPAVHGYALRDRFSLTEASLCFRWPIPAGRMIPTMPSRGSVGIPAPDSLPQDGARLGHDPLGSPVSLSHAARMSHVHLVGATGSGKSTAIVSFAADDLERGTPFVLIDPHGSLVARVRDLADRAGRAYVLVDAAEDDGIAIDLLTLVRDRRDVGACERAINRIIDAITSHLPNEWAGPRFRQTARAALTMVVAASGDEPYGMDDVGRVLIDTEFAAKLAGAVKGTYAATVVAQLRRDQDQAGVALWASSKFEDFAKSPDVRRIIAPFGRGLEIGQTLDAGIPILVNLASGRLSRLVSGLVGHIMLASTIDWALARDPRAAGPVSLYVDEAHRFPAVNLVDALAETRKYGLSLVLAHQNLAQLDGDLREALLSNAGTRLVFRSGPGDAGMLGAMLGVPAMDVASQRNLDAFVQASAPVELPTFSVRLASPGPLPEVARYAPAHVVRDLLPHVSGQQKLFS